MKKEIYTLTNIVFEPIPTHPNFKDLSGEKFGRLTVIGFAGFYQKSSMWFCECECGEVVKIRNEKLNKGATKSCGCLAKEKSSARFRGIAFDYPYEYKAYQNAKYRCQNPKAHAYKDYGGRGIKFNFNSFEEFINEVGKRPTTKHSLDRKNVDGNYEKGNVRWATNKTQQNNRQNTIWVTINGDTKSASEWAEFYSIDSSTVIQRLKRGKHCLSCVFSPELKTKCSHKTENT